MPERDVNRQDKVLLELYGAWTDRPCRDGGAVPAGPVDVSHGSGQATGGHWSSDGPAPVVGDYPWSETNDAIQASAAFQFTVISLVDHDWMSSM